jgi:cyclopropane fatty-acyl-phospholipid synthase-like methyltransferase
MQKNWYENFFQGITLDMWRKAVTPEQTRSEVDFLEKALQLPSGGRVLDNPCGNGRHSLELAARGYRVTGIDLSAEFVAEAKATAASGGLDAEFLQQDMRAIDAEAEFDGAFCFGNSFSYIDYAESCAFLAAVSRSLKQGARFALESGIAAESLLPKLESRRWMLLDDILFLSSNRYDAVESRLDIQYTFIRSGHSETHEACSYIYTLAEIRRMLSNAGLQATDYYSSVDQRSYELGSPRLLLVAEKR